METCLAITTWNRTPQLRNSLERLTQLTVPDEVLIVDDGSVDGCRDMAIAYSSRLPIRYVRNERPYEAHMAQSRNVGIKSTEARLWIACDPEVYFVTDVIAQLVEYHRSHPESSVSAGTVEHLRQDGSIEQVTRGWVAPYAFLCPREWVLSIGGLDERFPVPWGWEDIDFYTRLRLAGHDHWTDPEIVVQHQWHPPMDKTGQHVNEEYFRSRSFMIDQEDLTDLVANAGAEWGVPVV